MKLVYPCRGSRGVQFELGSGESLTSLIAVVCWFSVCQLAVCGRFGSLAVVGGSLRSSISLGVSFRPPLFQTQQPLNKALLGSQDSFRHQLLRSTSVQVLSLVSFFLSALRASFRRHSAEGQRNTHVRSIQRLLSFGVVVVGGKCWAGGTLEGSCLQRLIGPEWSRTAD